MTDPITDFLARTGYADEPTPSPLNGYEAAAWMVRVRADLPEARRLLRDAQERIARLEEAGNKLALWTHRSVGSHLCPSAPYLCSRCSVRDALLAGWRTAALEAQEVRS